MDSHDELYEHHLILKMSDAGIDEAETYLSHYFGGEGQEAQSGEYFIKVVSTLNAIQTQRLKRICIDL